MVDLLVRTHGRGRVLLCVVRRTRFSALREDENEDGAEPPGHPGQQSRADAGLGQPARFSAEQVQPVLFMATLRIGQALQDVAFLARLACGERLIDHPLGALLDEVPRPAATIGRGRLGGSGRCHESSSE